MAFADVYSIICQYLGARVVAACATSINDLSVPLQAKLRDSHRFMGVGWLASLHMKHVYAMPASLKKLNCIGRTRIHWHTPEQLERGTITFQLNEKRA